MKSLCFISILFVNLLSVGVFAKIPAELICNDGISITVTPEQECFPATFEIRIDGLQSKSTYKAYQDKENADLLHFGSEGTFRVDLNNGTYYVSLNFSDSENQLFLCEKPEPGSIISN